MALSDYASLDTSLYALSPKNIQRELRNMAARDSDSLLVDFYVKRHYARHRGLVWITRKGLDHRTDTLLAHLQQVKAIGFNPRKFRIAEIETDLWRARNLDFDNHRNTISKVYARLEYNLTKAYFRYAAGQQFGFVNPYTLFNRLDVRDSSNGRRTYRTLFDLPCPTAKAAFYNKALRIVHNDSLPEFLHAVVPDNPYYKRFLAMLHSGTYKGAALERLYVNLERSRWRMPDYPWQHKKLVLVNIPSFRLWAINGEDVLDMRIGCGSLKTKTPLLSSHITRMDINPQWIMPRSIVKKSIIPRLGNTWYFKSRNYFIRDRSTGMTLPPSPSLRYGLEDGSLLAIQRGGEGNALGRIIFRFDNNFSIYLHDTSSKDVFSRDDRDVSHGCIRVQRPFDLAVFLLGEDNRRTIDRIRYSMQADVSSLGRKKDELTDEEKAVADTLKRDMLIGSAKVEPTVPVYLLYFTLFFDAQGRIHAYDDVYGFDDIIYRTLKNYL